MSSPSPKERNRSFNDAWSRNLLSDPSSNFSPVIVITGAASGLGNVIARRMAEMLRGRKARFFLVGRNVDSGLRTIADLRRADESYSQTEGGWIDPDRYTFLPCDLTLMQNVHALASTISSKVDKVNYLIHSAGTANVAFGANPTEEGIQSPELATRYYARFALTYDLLPLLRRGASEGREGGGGGGRTTASVLSILGTGFPIWNTIDLSDLGFHKHFFGPRIMLQSGVYNDLFITQLAKRESSSGISFTHTSPGMTRTSWWSDPGPTNLFARFLLFIFTPLILLLTASAEDTTEATIYALLSGKGGKWYRRSRGGNSLEKKAFAMLEVEGAGERLWEHSIRETRCVPREEEEE